MKKRILCLLIVVCSLLSLLPVTASADAVWDGSVASGFASGSGTKSNPYIIKTAAQLAYFAQSVNSGTTYEGKYIKLSADIVLNDTSNWKNWDTTAPANKWTPIGYREWDSSNYVTTYYDFKGTFDGDSHTVSGIYINTDKDDQGLFGAAYGSTIKNVGVIASYICGGNTVGGVVASGSNVTNCYNKGNVSGAVEAGYGGEVGGVVGCINDTIENCYNAGNVSGAVDAGYSIAVGGVVGNASYYTVENCYNTGTVSGTGEGVNVGGVVGYYGDLVMDLDPSDGILKSCYNMGSVTGNGCVGGVIGCNGFGPVENCYNTGKVTGGDAAGGVVGSTIMGTLKNCYNAGTVTGDNDIGGVIGYAEEYEYASATNCYYLKTCVSNPTSTKGKALTDAQMKQKSSFTGFNFSSVWKINNGIHYPVLRKFMKTNEYEIIDGKVYYYDKNGNIDDDGKHDFSSDGYLVGDNLFITINDHTYYLVNNTVVTNYYIIDNRIYYFGSDGKMTEDGKHEFSEDGYIIGDNIFVTINNNTYYIVNNTVVTNYYVIDNRIYYFGSDGVMTKDGIHTFSPEGYISGNNVFITINNNTYYIVNNTVVIGYYIIDNRVYYFGSDGAMTQDGKNTFSPEGYITGSNIFVTINNNTYCIVNNTIVTNYHIVDNRIYYFGNDGVMTGDGTHSFSPDGYITGNNVFITINNNTYYIVNNTIVTNYYIIDNRIYYFGDNGVMSEDDQHRFSPDGYILGDRIFVTINNIKYYLINNTVVVPETIVLTNLPAKLEYIERHEVLDVAGGHVTLYYENGIQESFDLEESMVTGFDNTVVGKQTLTVNYCGKTAAFDVEILEYILPGDVDDNEKRDILDVMAIINIITGALQPTDTQYARADLNGDGTVNILDAMALINQITGA